MQVIKQWFRKKVDHLAKWMLPLRTKRMVLIGSIIAIVSITLNEKDKKQLVEKLNHEFDLAEGNTSIMFAVEVGTILWSDLKKKHDSLKESSNTLAKLILDNTPDSLIYADRDIVLRDIVDALHFINKYAKPV